MRYIALAADYDGTLAAHGIVDETTLETLRRLRESGRKLIMVTGRELPDLKSVFQELDLFDCVVAENGALLYHPHSKEECPLAEHAPQPFLDALTAKGVPFSAGQGIVATWEPHQTAVLEIIRELGLELQVIFNKGAVMVLPSGVNKGTGLRAALEHLILSPHNVVGVGDAENDHAFLSACEFAVAVENALPMLKERADLTTSNARGAGVAELIDQLLEDDLERYDTGIARHRILIGEDEHGNELFIAPQRGSVLFAGPSGSGKSTAATGVFERIAEQDYQFCLIDPEGDYESFPGALSLGSTERSPNPSEVLQSLENVDQSVVVNLLGIALEDRPMFFAGLFPRLQEMRIKSARPHWVIIDEAHHLLPANWQPAVTAGPHSLKGMILITVHPDHVAPSVLDAVNTVVAVGKDPANTIRGFAEIAKIDMPDISDEPLGPGEALVFFRNDKSIHRVKTTPSQFDRKRHLRKYAEGELPPDRSFYFRGADDRLNLRAQNLILFAQMAAGVDDETWLHHLRRGEYSQWFRRMIKDDALADEAAQIERDENLSAEQSKESIRAMIDRRYTAAA
jgi:hydroxymethylpyrimidine pyrophosphatase-like HAD family hydrolase